MRAKGFKRARARVRRSVSALEEASLDALAETVDAVHRAGRQNIQAMVRRRSGRLSRFYRKSISRARKLGRVGYLTRRARREAFYARFVHDGTRRLQARPFHDQAVAQEDAPHLRRMGRAVRKALRS
ncbi:hypothetical protein [Pseudaestuariivita rosea]|uniref:hypothetical protein n=1 Tax=Pseudaestuariivita rosea TaxID=2763263 RepID=UPI001ABB4AAA|nr:hypothetical protein [Pseudaestuariivita rosea]